MANNDKPGQAQHEAGQLYIDLGVKGLGSMLKGFNRLSAQFLLTKNAAQQFIKPIADVTKKSLATVTGWDKLNATMGLSLKQLQDINIFSKLNNVDFNQYIGQIKSAQQRLLDIQTGMSNDVQGFALLGLNPREFDANNPLELLDAIKNKVQQVDEVTASAALRWFGFSDDLLYVWKQQNTTFNERLKLSDREMENLKETQGYWNSLSATWDAAQSKFISNQTWINDLLKKTTNWLAGMHPHLENIGKNFAKWLEEDHPALSNFLTSMDWAFTTSGGEKWEGIKDFYLGGTERTANLFKDPVNWDTTELNKNGGEKYKKFQELWKNNPANPENRNVIPDALKPSTGVNTNATTSINYTNNITQYVSGTDAQQIASDSASKISDATELNAIQLRNQSPL